MNIDRLLRLLELKRPHNSGTEHAVFDAFLAPVGAAPVNHPETGEVLAYSVLIGAAPTTLFSSHVDTVHDTGGPQTVRYDPELLLIYKDDLAPLGADDGAGVCLMLEMIEAGVPGMYLFHRGEERGGIGSSGIARHMPDFLAGIRHAIAFDRRSTGDVITHQGLERCCSDTFAQALADRLGAAGLTYTPCSTGVYTDTAEYTSLVPECTNLSVGYYDEHSNRETLDVEHLLKLCAACCDPGVWDSLPFVRLPATDDYGIERSFYIMLADGTCGDLLFAIDYDAARREAEDWVSDYILPRGMEGDEQELLLVESILDEDASWQEGTYIPRSVHTPHDGEVVWGQVVPVSR